MVCTSAFQLQQQRMSSQENKSMTRVERNSATIIYLKVYQSKKYAQLLCKYTTHINSIGIKHLFIKEKSRSLMGSRILSGKSRMISSATNLS